MCSPPLTWMVGPIMNLISGIHIYVVGSIIHVRGGLHIYIGGVKNYSETITFRINLICSDYNRAEFILNSCSVPFNISTENLNWWQDRGLIQNTAFNVN